MKIISIKKLVIFSIFILFCCISFSQQNADGKFWDRVRFGGNIGANFGNNFSSVLIAPQAIYQVNPYVGLGLGLNYSYSERDLNRFDDFTSTIVGGSLIAIGQPIDFLQLSADFEYLRVNRNFRERSLNDEYWVPALFLGAGYQQGNFVVGARYDVLFNDRRSIYSNGIQPFVRLSF